jgi:hypothetical protein
MVCLELNVLPALPSVIFNGLLTRQWVRELSVTAPLRIGQPQPYYKPLILERLSISYDFGYFICPHI